MRDNPIGIFDSGIGGLTVAKEILRFLPNESIVYLGDTARVPYGSRDEETITQYALELTQYLLTQNVKILVVACNTISATCLSEIKKVSPFPVIDVIEPTVAYAVTQTKSNRVGIIGTKTTINSHIYQKKIKNKNPKIQVTAKACPLFVPLVEEGFLHHPATKILAKDYLKGFSPSGIDTLLLGCTHYPLLKSTIQEIVGKDVVLIDSAKPTALALNELLRQKGLESKTRRPTHRFLVTGGIENASAIRSIFLKNKLPGKLERVNLFIRNKDYSIVL